MIAPMARIVYGISGEGSGHASRARVVLGHLRKRGHDVRAVSYDRGVRDLSGDFDVFETEGLHIATEENRVSVMRTFTSNVRRLPRGWAKARALRQELFVDFEPEVVLCDFEPMTAYLAHSFGVPLVSIDNQHRMRYMQHPVPDGLRRDAAITKTIIRGMVPAPDAALITTFHRGALRNDRTWVFPPLLRDSVRNLVPRDDGHVLVYVTKAFDGILEALAAFPHEHFVVYGYGRETPAHLPHVSFHPPSQDGFLAHLAGAKAVVSTAGFTLMTESLFLRKPMLAMPMEGQFEQELNAFMLEQLDLGRRARPIAVDDLGRFLEDLPTLRERLEHYDHGDPLALLGRLDELLGAEAAEARELRARRRGSVSGPRGDSRSR